MTDPTPTPNIAAIIAEARELFTKKLACFCNRPDRPCTDSVCTEALLSAASRTAEAEARVRELTEAFRAYVLHFGPACGDDCPGDDTCECSGKALNDRVNAALSASPPPGRSLEDVRGMCPQTIEAALDEKAPDFDRCYGAAQSALLALGCRLGDNGWERPCMFKNFYGGRVHNAPGEPFCCGTKDGWLPITAPPPAPSGEEANLAKIAHHVDNPNCEDSCCYSPAPREEVTE